MHAFEPIPFTHRALKAVSRILRLSNVEVYAAGCGGSAGRASFVVPIADTGAPTTGQAHFAHRQDERVGKGEHVRTHTSELVDCEIVTLDQALPAATDVSLIKCDIEGAELSALRGGDALLNAFHPTIICEINPWFLEGFGQSVQELVVFLTGKGYEMYSYDPAGRKLERVDMNDVTENNYVFLHERFRARFTHLLSK